MHKNIVFRLRRRKGSSRRHLNSQLLHHICIRSSSRVNLQLLLHLLQAVLPPPVLPPRTTWLKSSKLRCRRRSIGCWLRWRRRKKSKSRRIRNRKVRQIEIYFLRIARSLLTYLNVISWHGAISTAQNLQYYFQAEPSSLAGCNLGWNILIYNYLSLKITEQGNIVWGIVSRQILTGQLPSCHHRSIFSS